MAPLSCVLSCFRVCSLLPCGHYLRKGWPLGSRLWHLIVFLSLSHVLSRVRGGTWLYRLLISCPLISLHEETAMFAWRWQQPSVREFSCLIISILSKKVVLNIICNETWTSLGFPIQIWTSSKQVFAVYHKSPIKTMFFVLYVFMRGNGSGESEPFLLAEAISTKNL